MSRWPKKDYLFFIKSLSLISSSCSFRLSLPPCSSSSPAVFLLTLTMCTVNNWWSSLTQRVTGPRENVSPVSLFIYGSIFKSTQSQNPPRPFIEAQTLIGVIRPEGDCHAVLSWSWSNCCDHEWVNAACLAVSRTERGKGSLNEWEVGG